MRILLINYRYFVSGGPERYMFNLTDLLESKGHEVIPFSVRYARNRPSRYDRYFVSPLSSENEVYFREQSWNVSSFLRTLQRVFYSEEVYRKLSDLIKDTKPDVALVLHYLRKLSPSVLTALADNNVPFAVRLSDFAMVCPNAHMLRKDKVCELCLGGSLIHSVRYRCVQGSFGASLVNYAATGYHKVRNYFGLVPYFITPSKFLKAKMVDGGWEEPRLVHIPTFVEPGVSGSANKKKSQIIFVGRLERSKGVHVLLEALRLIKRDKRGSSIEVFVVGRGAPSYTEELMEFAKKNDLTNVHFTGEVSTDTVLEMLRESTVSVVPSICYDNMPNSLLESLACGTPVIASEHGSLPEMVEDGTTGLLFQPGNSADLADKIVNMLGDTTEYHKMSLRAVEFVREHHSPSKHYRDLMQLFSRMVDFKSARMGKNSHPDT